MPLQYTEDLIFKYFPELDEKTREAVKSLGPLYIEWNSRINVISRKDIDSLYLHHVLHSLAIYKWLRQKDIRPTSIIDVGTGGGFPGIPLSILLPETSFTLCDSIAKKIKVVGAVAEALGLTNVSTIWSRSETVKEPSEYIVSRGVSRLDEFASMAGHLATKGIIYLKGGDLKEEIEKCAATLEIAPSSIETCSISQWFEEDFFSEKGIVYIPVLQKR